jgi:hypothetical protein
MVLEKLEVGILPILEQAVKAKILHKGLHIPKELPSQLK